MKHEILIAGSGGQGVLFPGKILACAAMNKGHEVTYMESYGAEVRGGTVKCHVIISDQPIASPLLRYPDIFIVLNKLSYDFYLSKIKSNGTVLINGSVIKNPVLRKDLQNIIVDTDKALPLLADGRVLNVVMLGAAIHVFEKFLTIDDVIKALNKFLTDNKKKYLDINIQALKIGYSLLEKVEK